MYYLQDRYYDPNLCRFISSDTYASTGLGLLGNNMFAYCENNPVEGEDPHGGFVLSAIATKIAIAVGKAAIGASINVLTTYIGAKVTGQSYTWKDAGIAALSGALGTGGTAMKIAAGAVSGIYSGYVAYKNGASIGGAIAAGAVSAYGTTASVANIATWTGVDLSIGISTFTDFVFGTGANSIAAATYRVSVDMSKPNATNNKKVGCPTAITPQKLVKKPTPAYNRMIAYKKQAIMEQRFELLY